MKNIQLNYLINYVTKNTTEKEFYSFIHSLRLIRNANLISDVEWIKLYIKNNIKNK